MINVTNMQSSNGNPVPNQFIIQDEGNYTIFQSYNTVIAKRVNGKVYLDINSWDYSVTTGKYRNQFLGETKKRLNLKSSPANMN
jgi:hypothetical protein